MPGPPPEHPHLRLLKRNPGKRAQNRPSLLGPEPHKLNLLTVLDIGPFSAYCRAYAHWQQAEGRVAAFGQVDDRDR